MRRILLASLLPALAFNAACGSDDETSLDCAWLADQNNCWAQVANAVTACRPEGVGTFDENRNSCSFDDGFVVDFAGPVSLPWDGEVHQWRFTAGRDGATCLEVEETGNGDSGRMRMTTSAGTASVRFTSGGSIEVSCPGDERYKGSLLNLMSCEEGLFSLPGFGSMQIGNPEQQVGFVINGAGEEGFFGMRMLDVWMCSDPGPFDPPGPEF